MEDTRNNNQKKSDQFSNDIISPMFGHDYKNRVVVVKNDENLDIEDNKETNYLERQIEENLVAQTKIAKVKEYQEKAKTDTDVLKQYHKQKENEELKAALPSNYLNFRDNLEKTSDLSVISDFNLDSEDRTMSTIAISETNALNNTISEILDDIFDK